MTARNTDPDKRDLQISIKDNTVTVTFTAVEQNPREETERVRDFIESSWEFAQVANRIRKSLPEVIEILNQIPTPQDLPFRTFPTSQYDEHWLNSAGSPTPGSITTLQLASVQTLMATQQEITNALSITEVAKRLRVSASRIRQKLAEGTLRGIKINNTWRVYAFLVPMGEQVPSLDQVLKALPQNVQVLALRHFLNTPDPDLSINDQNVSPTEWLLFGQDPARVVELAHSINDMP